MNEIFLLFFSLSLSGSLIALLLFLLKPIIKNRLSKTWQYYMFLIVVVRLLFPFGTDTDLMGMIFNQLEDYVVAANIPVSASDTDNIFLLPEDVPQEPPGGDTTVPLSATDNITGLLTQWLWLAWLVPAALLLLRKVFGYCRSIRSVRNGCRKITHSHIISIYRETCEAMSVNRLPEIAVSRQVATPMIIGIIRPVIVLPDTDLKDTDMHYIFQHELTHYKRLDIAYKWLIQISLCLHWFNPVTYWIKREVNRNCELSCDEAVIRRLDERNRYAYGDMLLSAIKLEKTAPYATVSITLSEDAKLIKERLEAIMTYKKHSRKMVLLSALLVIILLFVAGCAGAYTPPGVNPAMQNTDVLADNAPIIIEQMEIQYYENDDPAGRWPYLHWINSNISDKTVTGYEMACLAYDKDGKPLELDWTRLGLTNGYQIIGYTNQSDKAYEHIITLPDKPILPGEKEDLNGGWSLYDGWNQADSTHNVAYVLACMKQVTFEDGTVWENPEYQNWLTENKGNCISTEALAAYYG